MAKVKWQKRARQQEREALAYALREYQKSSVKSIYEQIKRVETILANNPRIGAHEYYLARRSREYRSLFVPKFYKIVYYIKEETDTVWIVGFWDTRKEPVLQASRLS